MKKIKIPEFKISYKSNKGAAPIVITGPEDVAQAVRSIFDADMIEWVESMVIIGLNRANEIVGFYKISQGGVSGTVADPKVVMQFALLSNSSAVILAHNHPSGSLRPSAPDIALTHKLDQAARLFDINLYDHIIITKNGTYSMKDQGDF